MAVLQVINVETLTLLSAISGKLNVLEKKYIKRDLDLKKIKGASKKETMPDLQNLRQDAFIHIQVDQRLRELSNKENSDTNIKSPGGSYRSGSPQSGKVVPRICFVWF